MEKLTHHVFICTNERPDGHPRGCCKARNSEEVLKAFKEEVAKRNLKSQVRAQKAGCLDVCEEGASVVVYPEGIWYGKVSPTDVTEIVQSHLVEGRPVQRLKIPGK
ncbi:(2Fe-2S) ferredoxin domain-containing protein [bacterium]|jgi:(2Fe-2S) ferredoxin|nr:(2Fe-2S) ferredoxin domain-containing protein [bacterium]